MIRSLPWLDRSGGPVATQINWEVWLFYLFHAMPVIALGIAWWRARRGDERWVGESAGVAAIAVMAIVMNLGSFARRSWLVCLTQVRRRQCSGPG